MRNDRRIAIIGTTRKNAGIVKSILDFVKSNKNNSIPWGIKFSKPTIDSLVSYIAWKDIGK